MSKKLTKSVSKIVLAGTLGLTGLTGSLTAPQHQVHAETSIANVDYKKNAEEFITLLMSNKWEEASKQFSKHLQPLLTKEVVVPLLAGMTTPYGKVLETKYKDLKTDSVHTNVTFEATAEKGAFNIVLKLDQEGKVDDFAIEPLSPPVNVLNPTYNNPENYSEKQFVIGEGKFSLPGVLTVPKGKGPFPVVVLVHGSGAHDKDSSIYSFKPFRDIAVGLANEGIAVLRYEKRTKAHPAKSMLTPNFSIQEETVLDANLAVEKLKSLPEIDSKNIFVLGHSQGAFALPLIIENDKKQDIKGAIHVAGVADKFHHLMLWQFEEGLKRAEKMKAPAEQIKALKDNLAFFKAQFSILDDPQYSADKVPPTFQLGGASWWFGLRDYVPTVLAKKQNVPMLVIQGDKDLQVPTSQYNKIKAELKDRKNVDYKIYPDMFHALVNYPGEPDYMTEYMTPGNVPQEFISDVSEWMKTGDLATKDEDLSSYIDFEYDQYWSKPFTWAINKGIIVGYEKDRLLKPYSTMTESQYLRVFFRYTHEEALKDESLTTIYSLAKKEGLLLSGKQNSELTRGQAAVLLAKSFTKKTMSENQAVQWLYDHNIVSGYLEKDGTSQKTFESFKANEPMTRAHIVTMLSMIDEAGLNQ
ncbi:alpha/beta fold hydrolase [Peribacillus acanthi]|uniref:alpha/beta fold hydrolase n=1 Tax=Peribacillus acanthi TaxID=2171554 RepID=UPI000D3E676A|nr:alpha/beta fold hydrolase [Peribacillus acanthi]